MQFWIIFTVVFGVFSGGVSASDIEGGAHAFGGVDSKVTNATLARGLVAHAIAGPPHDDQPPFAWGERGGAFEQRVDL